MFLVTLTGRVEYYRMKNLMATYAEQSREYLNALPSAETLYVCVRGEDRSVSLADMFEAEFLPGGLNRYNDLLIKLGHQNNAHPTENFTQERGGGSLRRGVERELKKIEQKLQAAGHVVVVISEREEKEYQIAIKMIRALNLPNLKIIHATGLGELGLRARENATEKTN